MPLPPCMTVMDPATMRVVPADGETMGEIMITLACRTLASGRRTLEEQQ